jgi:hypothetical protein
MNEKQKLFLYKWLNTNENISGYTAKSYGVYIHNSSEFNLLRFAVKKKTLFIKKTSELTDLFEYNV